MAIKQNIRTFLFLFLLFSIGGFTLAFWGKSVVEKQIKEEVEGVKSYVGVPAIMNVPPVEARVGQAYSYKVSVVDSDTLTGDLLLTLVEPPPWIFKRGLEIYGTPDEVGTYEIRFTVTDGDHPVEKVFYVVVTNDEETS